MSESIDSKNPTCPSGLGLELHKRKTFQPKKWSFKSIDSKKLSKIIVRFHLSGGFKTHHSIPWKGTFPFAVEFCISLLLPDTFPVSLLSRIFLSPLCTSCHRVPSYPSYSNHDFCRLSEIKTTQYYFLKRFKNSWWSLYSFQSSFLKLDAPSQS